MPRSPQPPPGIPLRKRSHRSCGAGLALWVTLLSPLDPAHAQPAAALSVSAPPGGCRLTWLASGTGLIHYGAAPWQVRVAPFESKAHHHQIASVCGFQPPKPLRETRQTLRIK